MLRSQSPRSSSHQRVRRSSSPRTSPNHHVRSKPVSHSPSSPHRIARRSAAFKLQLKTPLGSPTSSSPTNAVTTDSTSVNMSAPQRYDFAVIGGGSGGMAAAKEAARHGKKVVVFDFVKPSPQGTKWGLGGTCVNVGCVPKKLMHYGSLIGTTIHQDAQKFGWDVPNKPQHDWTKLVETVQNHIHSLNFGYRTGLRSAKVEYINALASFEGPNTLSYTLKGQNRTLEADHILIATGGRPLVPDDVVNARELAISSDDLFSLEQSPGKTLVVGASYIALECAGFLTELGLDTTVAVRSVLLRGFDRDCVNKIHETMVANGTKFVHNLPTELQRVDDKTIEVTFANGTKDTYNTVLYATGRYADTRGLGLEKAGVTSLANGKFNVDDNEATNITNIHAIGDILQGRPELTPVAIKTGELLAQRLFANGTKKMDWNLIPTTVFTPVEYGTIGYSEEDAIERYGDDVRTYLFEWTSLEHAAAHRQKHSSVVTDMFDTDMPLECFSKLVTLKSQNEKVIGFHYVGPEAGEVTQGYAVALKLGATKADFDDTMPIHPTNSEAIVQMSVTRESGEAWQAAGGCGGGKCG